ncbi:MAG: GGDEF domain-containing protein, partial [Chloroflexi bacterium]|nr:GGDEF domain-containing protein [Chloroflexota bacterium]
MSQPPAHPLRAVIRTYAWWYYLVLGIIAAVVYHWMPSLAALNLYYDVLASSTIVAIGIGIWAHDPPQRLPWYCFLLAQVLTSVGNVIWDYYELVLRIESPFPSVADVLYLAGYLPFTLGMLLLVRRRIRSGDIGSVIDAAMVTVSAGMLGLVYLMEPYIQDPTLTRVEQVVSVAYPLMDVFLVAIIAHILLSPGPRPLAYTFLGCSLILILGADITYAIMALNETYSTGSIIDYGWLLGYLSIGVAALHPSMRSLSALPPAPLVKLTYGRLIMLAAASLLGPAVLTMELVRGRPVSVLVILGGSALLFLLSLMRMQNLIRMLQTTMAQLETTLASLRSAVQNYQQVEALLSHQAFHDSLTQLPNRAMFKDRLQRALAAAQRHQRAVAVLFLDLDGFKYVNDRLGHRAGDELLNLLAQRLQTCVRPEDTAARLGGDEFTILLEQLPDIGGALQVAERIISELHAPFVIAERTLVVTASIGIAWSSAGQESVDEILRQADVAMYRAKAQGKACYALYDPAMNARALQRLDLESAL